VSTGGLTSRAFRKRPDTDPVVPPTQEYPLFIHRDLLHVPPNPAQQNANFKLTTIA